MWCTGWLPCGIWELPRPGVPCTGRQILNHWTTRGALKGSLIVKKGKALGMLWLEVVGPGKVEADKLERHGILYPWFGGILGFLLLAQGWKWGRKHEDGGLPLTLTIWPDGCRGCGLAFQAGCRGGCGSEFCGHGGLVTIRLCIQSYDMGRRVCWAQFSIANYPKRYSGDESLAFKLSS